MPQDMFDFEAEFERAVATYVDPVDEENPQLLAARIIAMSTARQRKKRWLIGISIAVPAVTCLLVMTLLHFPQPDSQPRAVSPTSIPAISPSTVASGIKPPVAKPLLKAARREIGRNEPRRLPKLDQFPAPTPMTEQEQLLIQFATQAPRNTQRSIAKTQKQLHEPLSIAKLVIPRLDTHAPQQ